MRFTKMQGAGNDYVYVNGFRETVASPQELARKISDRHFGVGSDGLILIQPPQSPHAHCRMEMYNADGSRAQMCGNGVRCVAKYAYDHGIAPERGIRIETDSGLKTVQVTTGTDGKVLEAEVDMGPPRLARADVPMVDGGDPSTPAIHVPLTVAGRELHLTAVSMGNPHAVVRLSDGDGATALDRWPVADLGPQVETLDWFPERTNTEFIVVRSPRELDFRVWERGSGETLACGTGACAAVVAAVVNGWCEREVTVHLRGGDLRIRWEGATPTGPGGTLEGGTVFMTGPAVEVFEGEWPE